MPWMTEFLLAAAIVILLTVAVGLVRLLRGPDTADRLLAAQLLATGGAAALLLFGVANQVAAIAEVALLLNLLGAFASVGFAARPGRTGGAGAGTGEATGVADAAGAPLTRGLP